MFKLVVLSAVLAVAAAAPRPGYLHAAPVAVAPLAIPTAVSHQSRIDYHSKPIIATYSAPAVVAAAPIIAPHTVVADGIWDGYGYGYGHGYGHGYGSGYGSGYGNGYGYGYGDLHGYGW